MYKKYFFIVNPASGGGNKLSFLSEISHFCQNNNLKYEVEITKEPKHATELAKQAVKNFEVVVAVGGDGTVNEVVNGIVGTRAVLGILPIGSGNDFSRQLGYRKKLSDDLKILKNGRTREVDAGVVNNEYYFINGFGAGFDGQVATKVKKYLPYVKGFLAYLLAVLSILPVYKFPRVRIELDNGKIIDKEILLIATCIGTTYGGGFKIAPSAKLNDGLFTICLIDKLGRWYALRNIPKIMKGVHLGLPEVHTYTSKKISIQSEKELYSQIDGELLPLGKKFSASIKEEKVKVIMA